MQGFGHIPFDVDESNAIGGLATWSRIMAFIHFVAAFFSLIGGCVASLGLMAAFGGAEGALVAALAGLGSCFLVVTGVVMILQGLWLWKAAEHFQGVVDTDGMDEALLAQGFDRLRAYFWVEAVLGALGVLSGLAAMGAAILGNG